MLIQQPNEMQWKKIGKKLAAKCKGKKKRVEDRMYLILNGRNLMMSAKILYKIHYSLSY